MRRKSHCKCIHFKRCRYRSAIVWYEQSLDFEILEFRLQKYTRKHSSRMRTASLIPYVLPVSVVTTRCQGLGPQMNKFQQVSSDHHQISLARGRSPGLMLRGTPTCDLYHDAFGVSYPSPMDRQIPVKTLASRNSFASSDNVQVRCTMRLLFLR